MKILNATADDFDTVLDLYDSAIAFQKTVFDKHWLGFDHDLLQVEISERRLWKIIEDIQIACIWSVAYEDPIIWGENSGDSAMYIHRIVTNSDFRGRSYVRTITHWAKVHANDNGLRYIRMDTWGDNQKLIDYYQDCGFQFEGLVSPNVTENLPKHYIGASLSLFEIDLLANDMN